MAGQIALVGGDEFRIGCEEMDHKIMSASGRFPARVLVVPTAAVDRCMDIFHASDAGRRWPRGPELRQKPCPYADGGQKQCDLR